MTPASELNEWIRFTLTNIAPGVIKIALRPLLITEEQVVTHLKDQRRALFLEIRALQWVERNKRARAAAGTEAPLVLSSLPASLPDSLDQVHTSDTKMAPPSDEASAAKRGRYV